MEESMTIKLSVVSIALIILCEVIGPGVYGCPSACLCYVDEGGLRTANCSGVKFIYENKYNKVFHEIGVLNIEIEDDEPTIKLWDDMFISFTKLKFLNLQNCRISHLPKNVFKGLKKIYEINLSFNDIEHFDNAVFENKYTLYKLNLRGNRLQGSTKPFISSSSLRELDLGYCEITNLQNEFFHGVKKLNRLYLDGNNLQTVKEHILPTRITHLNLANNRIVNVPISTINSLSQLRWLDLGANPINCTCALLNLQDILSGHATIINGDLRCAYPPELENISLSKVNENEVCNKETFSTHYHFKNSQTTKYTYAKKEYYFDNEKYNQFEIQGDDPGTSADYEMDENGNNFNEPKKGQDDRVNDEAKNDVANKNLNSDTHDVKPENLVQNETKEIENHENEETKKENNNGTGSVNNEKEEDKRISDDDKQNTDIDNENKDSVKNANAEDEKDFDNDTTPYPDAMAEDMDIIPNENKEKPGTDIFDETMKNDQVLPVGEQIDEHISSIKANAKMSSTAKNENNNDLEKHLVQHDSTETKPGVLTEHENDTNQSTNRHDSVPEKDPVEVEGSGGGYDENATVNSSIPLVNEDETSDQFTSGVEENIQKESIYPVEGHGDENSGTNENESIRQIVDKEPINYEEMGPIIVVACIIVFITIVVFIALYKGVCRSKENNRKPISDLEAHNGTELQDITSSLLPKSPVNDEKHNGKYPNEHPSPETVKLIKVEKIDDDNNERNHLHDLNQNDNKNDMIVKNGKPAEGSPPPIEKTTVKLTVLEESIPRTPIILQKRPTAVNNG